MIDEKAIIQASEALLKLDSGEWAKSCNPIIAQRIIQKIQPLIFQAKIVNRAHDYPDGFIKAVKMLIRLAEKMLIQAHGIR